MQLQAVLKMNLNHCITIKRVFSFWFILSALHVHRWLDFRLLWITKSNKTQHNCFEQATVEKTLFSIITLSTTICLQTKLCYSPLKLTKKKKISINIPQSSAYNANTKPSTTINPALNTMKDYILYTNFKGLGSIPGTLLA